MKGQLTHKDLVNSAYRWVLTNGHCGMALKELYTSCGEYPDVIGFSSWGRSVLIECKTSRSDFCADKRKRFRMYPEQGMGLYRFYCCPTGLLKVADMPDRWGLIYVNEKGRATCVHNPFSPYGGNIWSNGHEVRNLQAEHVMMYSALRRLHIRGHLETIYEPEVI